MLQQQLEQPRQAAASSREQALCFAAAVPGSALALLSCGRPWVLPGQAARSERDSRLLVHAHAHQRACAGQTKGCCRLSYAAIDDLMHQGVSDLFDRLRKEQLGLPPMSADSTSHAHFYSYHRTPFTYCYSAAVAPKPKDWGPHIDVVGPLPSLKGAGQG